MDSLAFIDTNILSVFPSTNQQDRIFLVSEPLFDIEVPGCHALLNHFGILASKIFVPSIHHDLGGATPAAAFISGSAGGRICAD